MPADRITGAGGKKGDMADTITATVKSKTQATAKNGTYWKLELVKDGEASAYTWSLFDLAAGEPIKLGERWAFETSTPPNPRGGVYRNIDKVMSRQTLATPESTQKAKETPQAPSPDLEYRKQKDESERVSIERQVAVKEGRLAADFLLTQYWRVHATQDSLDIKSWLEAVEPLYEQLAARRAGRFFAGMHPAAPQGGEPKVQP